MVQLPFLCKIFSPLENGLEPMQGKQKFLFIREKIYIARSKEMLLAPPKEKDHPLGFFSGLLGAIFASAVRYCYPILRGGVVRRLLFT